MKQIFCLLAAFALATFCSAQQRLLSHNPIPDSLSADAASVVRLDRTVVDIQSMESGKVRQTRAVTVLNRNGMQAAWFSCSCDKYLKLKNFKGFLYDKDGNLVRSIRKSDLKITEYSPHLATDGYAYILDIHYSEYPYTVMYEYDLDYTKGIIAFPDFAPMESFRQSVEQAEYSIRVPAEMGCNTKTFNFNDADISETSGAGFVAYAAVLKNRRAIADAPFTGLLKDISPRVSFAPGRFVFEDTSGSLASWEAMGNWNAGLLDGRTELSAEHKVIVHQLTDSCPTNRDKVKSLYDYLAETTRYVNISLGIGGFQPASADNVAEWKFGDCKGLTNYMRSMLAEAGIPADYATVSTADKRLYPDFPSFRQLNHVILSVPLPDDTVWIECTNPELPFGYVHHRIAGHDAILVRPGSSSLVKVPETAGAVPKAATRYDVTIFPDGTSSLTVSEHYTQEHYESRRHLLKTPPEEMTARVRELTRVSDAAISGLSVSETATVTPSIDISYSLHSRKFARKSGSRLFVPVNIFRRNLSKYATQERSTPFFFKNELTSDTVTISLPEGYTVEAIPKSREFSTPYLDFKSSVSQDGQQIRIVQEFRFKEGTFPAGINDEFRKNYNSMVAELGNSIALKKTDYKTTK